jgi:ABC-type sugar transport system substrate-binding protein
MGTMIFSGVDGTQDALAAMQAGDLDVTVFQDAAAQGKGAVDAALKLARGDSVEKTVWIPFELVTPATLDRYLARN